MLKDERVTRVVTLVELLPGEPPAIQTGERLRRPDGVLRHFAQIIPVPDPEIFSHLRETIHVGDEFEITTVTEWAKPGSPVQLVAFCPSRCLHA